MNFIQVLFAFFSSTIIIYGSLINLFEEHLPLFVRQIFKFGKFREGGKKVFFVIEVPKAWFKHFYACALPLYLYLFYLVNSVYVFDNNPPFWIERFLDIVCGENRVSFVSATKVYIAMCLITLQVIRRFYDTHFVSIFAKNSQMNITHYILGLIYYPCVAIAILCEAPYFADFSIFSEPDINLSSLSYIDIFAIILFLNAWWHQHICSKILASLRKNQEGKIVTEDHKVPHGDWFNFLSAPHQVAEILMYFSITLLLWYNVTWFFVFAWVLINQVETTLLSHWWYRKTFDDFPKERKALIPYVY